MLTPVHRRSGFPDQYRNESWHKNDFTNMLSDIWLEVHSGI